LNNNTIKKEVNKFNIPLHILDDDKEEGEDEKLVFDEPAGPLNLIRS
jgi:hypothetical protein